MKKLTFTSSRILLLVIPFQFLLKGADGDYAARNYKRNNYRLESDKYCFTNASTPGIFDLNTFVRSLNKEVSTMKSPDARKEYLQKLIRIKSSMCYATTLEAIKEVKKNAADFLDSVKKYEKCEFCVAEDQYGNEWATCAGETSVDDCPPFSHPGYVTWHCDKYLNFETQLPDYSQCNNENLGKLKDRFDSSKMSAARAMGLQPKEAHKILNELYEIVNPVPTIQAFAKTTSVKYFGHEIEDISILSRKTISQTKSISRSQMEGITKKSLKIILSVLANQDQWNQLSQELRPKTVTNVLSYLESSAFVMVNWKTSSGQNSFYESAKDDIYTFNYMENNPIFMEFGSKNYLPKKDTVVVSDGKIHHETRISVNISQMIQNPKLNNSNDEVQFVGMIIPKEYVASNLQEISPKNGANDGEVLGEELVEMNGNIVSFSLSQKEPPRFKDKDDSVMVMFTHIVPTLGETPQKFRRKLHPGEVRKATSICAFWDTRQLKWSTEGCRKINSQSNNFASTCSCNHLTAFSVLMGYHEYAGKHYGLTILTWILCPLSIFCLVITAVILATVKCARSDQSKITIHLCLTLIFGNIMLICTDKDNFHLSDWSCTVLGALNHYIWLCAFIWMAVTGTHLYYKVIKVFNSGKHNWLKIYSAVAYGLPLLIVAITAAIGFSIEKESIYVGEMFCWLKGPYLWSFKAPVLIIVTGNAVVLVAVLRIASKKNNYSIQKNNQRSINKKLITGTASLSALLGMTWIFGFFSLVDVATPGNEVIPYIFTILNASQGIFIFIFHCCLNETVSAHLSKTVRETFSFSLSSSSVPMSSKRATRNQNELYEQQIVNNISKSISI